MAQHQYEVELKNGQTYEVTTPHHHDDHHPETFQNHLLDILKSTVSSLLSAAIVHRVTYKGKK